MDNCDLRTVFDAAFIDRSNGRSWNTAQGRNHWLEAEVWQDAIAGPLWSIVKHGGCEYAYSREDSFFTGAHDPTSLHKRLLEWHTKLASNVQSFTPASAGERRDQGFMQTLLENIRSVIDRALEIEFQRWQATRTPAG